MYNDINNYIYNYIYIYIYIYYILYIIYTICINTDHEYIFFILINTKK